MARRPGKAIREIGRGLPEGARPMVPEIFTEPLKMSVYIRPVMLGVEDAKRSCFGCLWVPSVKDDENASLRP